MIDTTGHMIAAYIAATAIYVAYTISLWVRARKHRHPEPKAKDPLHPVPPR
jgi:hypothetical protein